MDWNFNLSIPVALLAVLGAAMVAAGVVAYRGSTGLWVRALAAGAMAAGGALMALLVWLVPVSVTRGSAEGALPPAPIVQPSTPVTPTATPSAIRPSATPSAIRPAGPTLAASSATAGPGADWKLYRSEAYGLEFRYPGACTVAQRDGSFTVGGRIELSVAEAGGLAFRDYVARFMEERTRTSGWKLDSERATTVGGNNAVRVEYRFGGANRFGTIIFIEGKGRVYLWGLTAGGFTCDEPAAFEAVVASFRVTPPGASTPTGR